MKIKELAKLKEMIGEKISILKSSDLVPACYYGTLQGFKVDKWAQYENCLYIYIKLFRKRSINRIIITPNETTFIFKDNFNKCWNKEKINSRESLLHRITYNDVKNDNNLILSHNYGEDIECLQNGFIDITGDYLLSNCLNKEERLAMQESANYYNYIKKELSLYNVSFVLDTIEDELGSDSKLYNIVNTINKEYCNIY